MRGMCDESRAASASSMQGARSERFGRRTGLRICPLVAAEKNKETTALIQIARACRWNMKPSFTDRCVRPFAYPSMGSKWRTPYPGSTRDEAEAGKVWLRVRQTVMPASDLDDGLMSHRDNLRRIFVKSVYKCEEKENRFVILRFRP
jgi:hypothetical protein